MEYCGGYFLVLNTNSQPHTYIHRLKKNGIEVERIFSVDENVGNIFPKSVSRFDKRKVGNKLRGEGPGTEFQGMLFPNVFEHLSDAQKACCKLHQQGYNPEIIGISLDEKYITTFHSERAHDNDKNGEGVVVSLLNLNPIDNRGTTLGYDIAGYEMGGTFLSYIGNDLVKEYLNYYPNLVINKNGLVSEVSAAEHLAKITNEILIEEVGAEEIFWLPWKIQLYNKSNFSYKSE